MMLPLTALIDIGGKSAKGKIMRIKKNNPERRRSFRARHNCDNVELPVDSNSIIDELIRITEVDLENENALISALDDIVKNKKWSMLFPYPQIKASFDSDIFKKIPEAIAGAILSPKVILNTSF